MTLSVGALEHSQSVLYSTDRRVLYSTHHKKIEPNRDRVRNKGVSMVLSAPTAIQENYR